MLTRFINMVLLFLVAVALQSQQYNKKDFKVYSIKDGLSNNHINAITQDAYGYIWVGTEKGLNRFDGSGFQQYYSDTLSQSLPEDRVFNLKWINDEQLGVLTSSGLHIINSKTLKMHNLFIPVDSLKYRSVANRVFDIAADKSNNIFIITSGGFYHFNQERLVFRYDHYAIKNTRSTNSLFGFDLVWANNNTLLLSTNNGLHVYIIDKKDLHEYGTKDDPLYRPLAQPGQGIRFTFGDKNHFSAKVGDKETLVLFDINKRISQVVRAPANTFKKIDFSSNLFRLNDTLMAATSGGSGFYLVHLDKQTGSWLFDTVQYFENDLCTAILLDKNNFLWVGTTNGLYKQKRIGGRIEQTRLPGDELLFHKTITGLVTGNNKVFAATVTMGLYVFEKDSLNLLQHLMYPRNMMTQLLKANEDSLISAGNGFLINTRTLEYKQLEHEINIPKLQRIRVLLKDSHNRIYFIRGLTDTVYFKEPADKSWSAIPVPELKKVRAATQMAEDNERNIWIGSIMGLIRLNNQSKKIDLVLDSFPSIKIRNTEISSNIIFDSDGNMYFGVMDNGLVSYNVKEKKFTQLTRLHGLPDNIIKVLYLHKNTTLWIGTENGLASYDLNTQKISSFGIADGMPSDPNTCDALYYDPSDDYLYAAFTPVIVRFDPDRLKKNEVPPTFFIESIDITGRESISHPGEVVTVPYKHNSITVNLAAINFEDASQQLFAYRLEKEGNDTWQEIGAQRRIFLNDLPAGKYKLQVKVYIRNQSWPDQVKELVLTIKPPFWKTIWFYLIIGLLFTILLFYLHKRRVSQLTQKANIDRQLTHTEMKALHAQMNPHFIFNCLNSIREMILNNENQQASHYLSKFAQLIRITLNQSSKQFITLENTIDYLERYIEMEKIRNDKFNYTIEVDDGLQTDEIMIPPMLIQPFIENAIWHGTVPGKELEIKVRFTKEGDQLVCHVEDNGPGIETTINDKKEMRPAHNSIGISNVKERIKVLNEKYNLQSKLNIEDRSKDGNGIGTAIQLYFSLKSITV